MGGSNPSRSAARRAVLALVLSALVLAGIQIEVGAGPARAASNPVVTENQQPGTTDWRISLTPSDDVNKQIKGYASATSVNVGGTITLFVTVNPVQKFDLDIYRVGYYQGQGGRLMRHVGGIDGVQQPACPMDATTGMIACSWSASYQLSVPSTWVSGIYLAKLTNKAGYQNYIIFTVRDDQRQAALLYQQSVTTYQAYNNYPSDGTNPYGQAATGKSLYEYNSSPSTTGLGTTRAVKVSFDRPYSNDDGAGDFLDWELYFVRWVEESGYDVSYSTDVDTHENPARLKAFRGFLSVGHDEYWSKQMYDGVLAARDAGVSLGFFGANAVYWQSRMESSAGGAPDRVLTCYKSATLDPVQDTTTTVRFRDPQVNRPEQSLIGIMSTGQQSSGAAPASYSVRNSGHWAYNGAGVADGDAIPGVVGYETDRYVNTFPAPVSVPGSYTLLSSSPYTTASGGTDYANSSIYQAGSGAWVFAAGSIEYSWGLTNYGNESYADPRLQRLTSNVLDAFVADQQNPPPAAPSGLTASPTSDTSVALGWTDNATNETGYVVDRSTSATFDAYTSTTLPAGTTAYTDTVPSADVYYYRVRSVTDTSQSPYTPTATASTQSYRDLVRGGSGLVGYWRLGESAGTTAADSSGNGRAGQYVNAPTLGAAGAIARDPDTSVQLNGTSGKVSVPSLPATTDFTVEGWSYLTGTAANSTLYGTNGTVRILVRPGGGPTAYASVWLGGTEYALQPSTTQSNVGAWVSWALARKGSTLSLYRNGLLVAQRTDLPSDATADVSGWIGAQGGNAYYFAGRIDDVAVYSSAFSADDAQDHYVAGVNAVAPSVPPPPPAAPTGLAAAPSSSSVALTWTDNATNESSYELQRATTPDFASAVTTTLSADSTGATDTPPSAGGWYYRVRAVNSSGPSAWSAAAPAGTTSYDQLLRARTGLIGRWRLGEASGVVAADQQGSFDGQYQNGVVLGTAGALVKDPDTSASFNGTNHKVSLPALPAVTDFTVEGWTNLATANANSALYGTNGKVRILVRPGGGGSTAYASVWVGGTEYALQPTSAESNVGSWVYWVLTRSGGTLSLYRNGLLVGQRADLPASGSVDVSGWIGAQGGNAYYFPGRIDEVAVAGAAATPAQVAGAYAAGVNGLAPPPPAPSTTSYRDTVLAEPSLMSYWRLGESSGTTAKDAKGTNDGAYVNGVSLGTPGAVVNDPDTSASFNGSTNKVSLPALPAVGDFSVEGWSYLTSSASNSALYGTSGNVRLLVRAGGGGSTAYAGVWLGGTEYVLQPSTAEANANTWVHWVLTRAGGTLTLYRNGVQVGQRTDLPATATANVSGWIGAQSGNAYYFGGRIDEMAVYTTALSRSAVQAHYAAATTGPAPAT